LLVSLVGLFWVERGGSSSKSPDRAGEREGGTGLRGARPGKLPVPGKAQPDAHFQSVVIV